MFYSRQSTHQILKRLLTNGRLTALPMRRADESLLLRMAAARFEAGRPYREAEVNELLERWLATFCEPHGIDHVTLRRRLVDTRLLVRDTAGAEYRLAPGKGRELAADETLKEEPARVLEEIREEREARKRQYVPSDVQ
jgi:hypothetical protein